jgi:hypothetical protein
LKPVVVSNSPQAVFGDLERSPRVDVLLLDLYSALRGIESGAWGLCCVLAEMVTVRGQMMRRIVVFFLGLGFMTAAFAAKTLHGWSNQGVEVELSAAMKTHSLATKLISFSSPHSEVSSAANVRIVDGDLTIDGTLDSDWGKGHGAAGLIVTGSLFVNGPIINANLNGGPFLVVGGKTRAKAIVGAGAEFLFVGDAVVEEIVVGEYNDGILRFLGSLKVPVAISNDHHFEIGRGLNGRWLEPFNEGHLWSSVLHPDIAVSKDEEGSENFDIADQLLPRLRSGAPVLRADLPPVEDYPELFE